MIRNMNYFQQASCTYTKFNLIDKTFKIWCLFIAKFNFLPPLQWRACSTWQWPHRKRFRKIPMIHHRIPLRFNITNNRKNLSGIPYKSGVAMLVRPRHESIRKSLFEPVGKQLNSYLGYYRHHLAAARWKGLLAVRFPFNKLKINTDYMRYRPAALDLFHFGW